MAGDESTELLRSSTELLRINTVIDISEPTNHHAIS